MTTPVVITSEAPGPGARFSRSAGQGGGALVVIELWQAFGWLGAGGWTAEQSAQRWPALTAALTLVLVAGHNAWNWWRSRPNEIAVEGTVDLDALPAADGGRTDLVTILIVIALALIILALVGVQIDLS